MLCLHFYSNKVWVSHFLHVSIVPACGQQRVLEKTSIAVGSGLLNGVTAAEVPSLSFRRIGRSREAQTAETSKRVSPT